MPLTADQRFAFDVQGFLHIRSGMSPQEVAQVRTWIDEALARDLDAFKAQTDEGALFLHRPISRIFDLDPRFARFVRRIGAA